MKRSVFHDSLQIPNHEDPDYEVISSGNISTRSFPPSNKNLVSPSASTSTLNLTVSVPSRDATLSTVPDGHTTTKDMTRPLTYPALGSRYTVISTIKESFFGSVHLAIDTICQRQVAIKISKRTFFSKGISRYGHYVLENVLNEAHIMRDLQSSTPENHHIAPLLDDIEDSQYHYLITPYYNHGDLYTYLKTLPHTRMNETQASRIFKQLVHAVAYLHFHGIAHRDLSLENIMLHQGTTGLDAYVIDFGVAAVNPAGASATTFPCPEAKLACEKPGKAMYISPELWSGQKWEAYSNDAFSLGVILYCMLVGRHPFNSSVDVWAQFITSGNWYKLLQQVAQGKSKPDSIYPGNYTYYVVTCQHISLPALNLISHLLCPIHKRYTLQQIMNHTWVKHL